MSDTSSVTPETGMEQQPAPLQNGQLSEEQAIAQIGDILRLGNTPQEEPKKAEATKPESEPEPEAEAEPQEEAELSEEDTSESESDAEGEELPASLEDFAKALEMEPGDLAEHIRVKVKVKGETRDVTLAEAVKGYQREGHYLGQVNELADERRKMEAQRAQIDQSTQQRWQELEDLSVVLNAKVNSVTAEEKRRILSEQGAEAFLALEANMEGDREALRKVQEHRQKFQQEQSRKVQEYRAEQQQRLAEAEPDLADPEKSPKVQREMVDYLEGKSFSADEIRTFFNGPFDHRHVGIIRDAARYRALKDNAPKIAKTVKNKTPLPKKSGQASDLKAPNKLAALRDRVSKARHAPRQVQEEAAVSLISEMIRS